MAWYPGAVRKEITRNFTRTPIKYDAVILHTDAGNAKDLYGWWMHPSNKGASSHFHVAKDGTVYQYVDTKWMSWTSGAASSRSIGIETQGFGSEEWTPAQFNALVKLVSWCCSTHNIPVRQMASSRTTERGIGWHRLGCNGNFPALPSILAGREQRGGGEVWSSARGKSCPGTKRINQIPSLIAKVKGGSVDKEPSVEKPGVATVGDGKSIWPQNDLPLTTNHTEDSHNAWVSLMEKIGNTTGPLGLRLQKWLAGLIDPNTKKPYYGGRLDGDFGPMSVKALQEFLKDKGYYNLNIDGDRGGNTVKAEIQYLNSQAAFFRPASAPATVPPKKEPAPAPAPKPAGVFEDVPKDHPQHEAIKFLKDNGITTGYAGGKEFRPGQAITRAEVAAFLYRYHTKFNK